MYVHYVSLGKEANVCLNSNLTLYLSEVGTVLSTCQKWALCCLHVRSGHCVVYVFEVDTLLSSCQKWALCCLHVKDWHCVVYMSEVGIVLSICLRWPLCCLHVRDRYSVLSLTAKLGTVLSLCKRLAPGVPLSTCQRWALVNCLHARAGHCVVNMSEVHCIFYMTEVGPHCLYLRVGHYIVSMSEVGTVLFLCQLWALCCLYV